VDVVPGLLLVLTMLAATALVVAVAGYVVAITRVLDRVGARSGSDLERVAGALRGIANETTMLTAVADVNSELRSLGATLQTIDGNLVAFVQAQG
jgi:hypothetical protein